MSRRPSDPLPRGPRDPLPAPSFGAASRFALNGKSSIPSLGSGRHMSIPAVSSGSTRSTSKSMRSTAPDPSWLKLAFTRDDAETYLDRTPGGSFVIRGSTQDDALSLTVKLSDTEARKQGKQYFNGLISKKTGQMGEVTYNLKGESIKFRTLDEIVLYYTSNKCLANPTQPLLRMPLDGPVAAAADEPDADELATFNAQKERFASQGGSKRASSSSIASGERRMSTATMTKGASMLRGDITAEGTSSLWFQPTLDREEAENIVHHGPIGGFIIRNTSIENSFSLVVHASLVGDRQIYCPLVIKEKVQGKFTFHLKGEEETRFSSLVEFVEHYCVNRAPKHSRMPLLVLPGGEAKSAASASRPASAPPTSYKPLLPTPTYKKSAPTTTPAAPAARKLEPDWAARSAPAPVPDDEDAPGFEDAPIEEENYLTLAEAQ